MAFIWGQLHKIKLKSPRDQWVKDQPIPNHNKTQQITTNHNKACTICKFFGVRLVITLTSHEHHDVSNHWQLDCSFNSLFRLTTKKISELHITDPLWGESTSDWWIPLIKGPIMRKVFPHHGIIMYCIFIMFPQIFQFNMTSFRLHQGNYTSKLNSMALI